VRISSPEDFDQINSLGLWFQQNSNFSKCGWAQEKARKFVLAGSDPESNTFLRVCVLDDEIVGFFLGGITEYFFSRNSIAQELVVVFKPDHRTNISPLLIDMVNQFELWAKDRDAVEISMGIYSGIDGKGYHKFLESRGYKQSGIAFKKEV
tara:strand:+ start:1471 stop:1923 length:453 start_codon:yes stop_codon:yes gene_type:complete